MNKIKLKKLLQKGMKISIAQIVCALFFTYAVYAGKVNAQTLLENRISITVTNMEMQQLLEQIQKQVPVKFSYSPSVIDTHAKISYSGKKVQLKEVLLSIFSPLNIGFKCIDNKIVLFPETKPRVDIYNNNYFNVQDKLIKGVVTDSTGKPLAGASVRVPGTNKGVSANADGSFSITVPDNVSSLIISYVGYTTETVTIGENRNNIVVVLKSAIITNQEVVVTALGISKQQRTLGYSVTTLNGGLLNQAKEPNVANSLAGRISGLNISSTSSGPGSSARILIRGVSNFSSNTTPLVVIDGIPMGDNQNGSPGVYGGADMGDGISSLNPDDIESITVLKGSTASALYGTRAQNGVIQVVTKSGRGANDFGVEYTSNFSLNCIINYEDYQKVYGSGTNGQRPQTVTDIINGGLSSWGEKLDGAPTIQLDGALHPYSAVQNQLNKFYRTAPVFINTVSVVNSGKNGSFRFSLSNTDNESVIPNSNLKRYSANLNAIQNITDKLKLSVMASYLNEKVKNRPFLNDMSRNPNWTMALLPADASPDYLKPGWDASGNEVALSSDGYMPNPWFTVYKNINNTTRNRFISSTTARYDFSRSLYLQGRVGLDYLNDEVLNIEAIGIGYSRPGNLPEQSIAKSTELNMDVLGGYSHQIVKNLDLNIAVGASQRKYDYSKTGYTGSQWTSLPYTVANLSSSQALTPSNYSNGLLEWHEKSNSLYYTADFTYNRFLTISTTGRWDWFSTVVQNPIFTPSVSTSFLFGNLVKIPSLSFGKLRASYAQTSGQALPYQTSTYYQSNGNNQDIPFGSTLAQTSILNLKPFRIKEFEVGTELKWFKNRLGLSATYFSKKTNNELISKSISIASAYSSIYLPLGSTSNKGLELELNGTPVQNKNFEWSTSFNFTVVKNKLISIGDSSGGLTYVRQSGQGQYRPSVGPYSDGDMVANVQGLPLAQILAYDYKRDASGNIITSNGIPVRGDLVPMGSGIPKYYGGLNNQFRYKNFNLSFLIDYRFGCKVLSATDFLTIYYGLNKATLPGRETGIVVKGKDIETGADNNTLVTAQNYYQGLVKNVSSFTVFDGSFIKLRQVTLGYTIMPDQLKKTFFESINVSLVARNLLILMKHTQNFDPEDSYSSLTGNAGLQGIGVPPTRTYGINVNFRFKK